MASFLKLLDKDNVLLDQYSWYAGDMNVNDAREHLDPLPAGKLHRCFCHVFFLRFYGMYCYFKVASRNTLVMSPSQAGSSQTWS